MDNEKFELNWGLNNIERRQPQNDFAIHTTGVAVQQWAHSKNLIRAPLINIIEISLR